VGASIWFVIELIHNWIPLNSIRLPGVGDIIYSQLLGQDYVIVNSEKVARALSDTWRSVVYADRPILSIYKL
jgi:hypothetical protein